LKGLNVLRGEDSEDIPSDRSTADTFLAVVREPGNAALCVAQLFPDGIPLDQLFFDRLGEFHRWTGIEKSGDEAIGIVWSQAMGQLDLAEQQQLLRAFAAQRGHEFFRNLGSLYVIVRDHILPASFLADWFADLLQCVERDLAQDGVWVTIRTLCASHPDLAIEVLWAAATPPDPRRLSVAGFILGTLRSLTLTKKQINEFERVEGFFEAHADNQLRAVFNCSWLTTARDSCITGDQLEALFDRAVTSQEDLSNIVSVVCRMTFVASLSVDLIHRCHQWLEANISSSLSQDAKFYVAWLAEIVMRDRNGVGGPKADTAKWILSIQPVPEDNRGTWDHIAAYLSEVLSRDARQFGEVFQRLCATSAATIHHLVSNRSIEHLTQRMHNANLDDLVGRLAVSSDKATRELGLYLFDNLEISTFPQTAFKPDDAFTSRVLFYEAQRTVLNPKSIARLLVAVIPIAEQSTDGFRDEVFDEVRLQCHNYAGECRAEFEAIGKDIPMVTKALKEVADYFAQLDHAHQAGVNGMEVADYSRAVMEQRRMFSRRMSQGIESSSVFLSNIKRVRLLYGGHTSHFTDGQLRDAMPLAHVSHSMELPIVEICAPEEMAIRRFHASAVIAALVAQYVKEHHTEATPNE
jgi:hypothetical protein